MTRRSCAPLAEQWGMGSVRDPVSVTPDNLSREYTSFQPCAPEPVVYLGRDSHLENPVALMHEQVVGLLDLVELEAMRDERAKIDLSLGGETQHGRILPCVTPSPLSCSRVIFKTRASNSALDKCSHTHFRRRMRSLRTQSSLLSRPLLLGASELKIASLSARIAFFANNISPHMAAEASPERRGRRVGAGCGCAASTKWAPDSKNLQSKDAARRGAPWSFLSRRRGIANRQPTA